MDTIKALLRKHREVIAYLIIGVMTTLVNWVLFLLLTRALLVVDDAANIAAVVLAVIFAYVTNKLFVFRSHCPTKKDFFREMLSFFTARALAALVEIGGYSLTKLALLWLFSNIPVIADHYDLLSKGFISVFVIALNYILSKLFVFRKKKGAGS